MSESSNLPSNHATAHVPWEAVFADAANGTPDKPTKAGLLALSRQGKDVWNAWRNAYGMRNAAGWRLRSKMRKAMEKMPPNNMKQKQIPLRFAPPPFSKGAFPPIILRWMRSYSAPLHFTRGAFSPLCKRGVGGIFEVVSR